jgi:hypothetical protein
MSTRPSLFGLRLRDKGRTVRVKSENERTYVVEDSNAGRTTRRRHSSAKGAVADAAKTWRGRLN